MTFVFNPIVMIKLFIRAVIILQKLMNYSKKNYISMETFHPQKNFLNISIIQNF